MGTTLPPLREFQVELLHLARRFKSTVIYAETGTGKTRIAVERILEVQEELVASGRLSVFLAPTVPLVRQQAEVLTAAGLRVVAYTGEDNRDARSRAGWQRLHAEADVLCATPDALTRLIAHAYIKTPQIGLLVLDECHHTNANHPYAVLLRVFVRHLTPANLRPVLLGLTASPHKAEELTRLLGAQLVAARDTTQLQRFMAKPRLELTLQEEDRPAPVQPRAARGVFSTATSVLPPECADAAVFGGVPEIRKAGEALHAGGGSWIAGQPMAALDGAIELVSAAVDFSRSRDQTFRRCCAVGEPLPELRAPRFTSPLLGGAETQQWQQDPQCGTKQLEHLRSQLSALKDALNSLGLWPAVAVAAADLFGPTAAPPQPAMLLRVLDAEDGSALTLLQQHKRNRGAEKEQHLETSCADDTDGSSDCEAVGEDSPAEHRGSSRGAGETDEAQNEGEDAGEDALWGYQIGELLEEGGLGDGSEAFSIADHRDSAALLVSGLTIMLPPALREAVLLTASSPTAGRSQHEQQQQPQEAAAAGGWTLEARAVQLALLIAAVVLTELVFRERDSGPVAAGAGSSSEQGGLAAAVLQGFAAVLCPATGAVAAGALPTHLHPLAARDRGEVQPWAELLVRALPLSKLQLQVGQDLPLRPAPATGLAAGGGVPLVTPAVQWVVRSLLALGTQHHADNTGGAASGGWAAMVFCQRKVACLALHRLLVELPAARNGDIRSAVFMGNTGAGHSAKSLSMNGKKQERVRRAFSAGAINVLISTSVGAEGLDFRTCNAVIMLDPADHVTPFVQCAGRARAAGSRYLYFVRDAKQQVALQKRVREEREMVDKALELSAAAVRTAQQQHGQQVQHLEQPQQGVGAEPLFGHDMISSELQNLFIVPHTGAVMCGPLAQNLLESYCRTLPGNSGDVLLQPYYSYKQLYENTANRRTTYVAIVHMPPNSPLATVEGPVQGNKADARQYACMAAVRKLCELGALDEHLLPKFTRRGRMREAQQQDLLEHKALPRVALSHRLPATLQPATAHVPPAAARPAGGGQLSGAVPPAASHACGEAVGHLYAFAFAPAVGSRGAGGGVATAAGINHRFGVALHRRLPYDLPHFTAYLPPMDGDEADEPLKLQPTPVAVRLEYLGPLRISSAQLAALETAGDVLDALLLTRGAPSTPSSPAAAGEPSASPVSDAGPAPGMPALAAWSERLGPGLAALRRALVAAGVNATAAYEAEATGAQGGMDGTSSAAAPAVANQSASPPGRWWWMVVPLTDQAQAATSQAAAPKAVDAVDWSFYTRLAAGPVPLQALCPQLPPLRPLSQQPAQGHVQHQVPHLDAAAAAANTGSNGGHGHWHKGAPSHTDLDMAVRDALRGSGGLLITQTGATLHALRGLAEADGASADVAASALASASAVGCRDVERDAARLAERWGVDPSCLLLDQPQVLMDAGTATRTSNVLLAPARPQAQPQHSGFDAAGQAPAVMTMLPQALAVAPLSLSSWRALHRTVSLVHRLEGLAAAAEAEEQLLRAAGFLQPALAAAGPILAPDPATTAASAAPSAPTAAAATPQQAAVLLALTALTTRAAADPAFDCERLETLGDAVLKYLATLYVYGTERDVPASHEGVMSYKRDQLVANEALYDRALGAGLQHYVRALPYDMARVLRGRRWAPLLDAGGDAARMQEVRGKRLADAVEALVGCHLAPGVPTAAGSYSDAVLASAPGPADAPDHHPAPDPILGQGPWCQDHASLATLVAALPHICAPTSGHDAADASGLHARLDAALRFCCGLGVLPAAAPEVLHRLGCGPGTTDGAPVVASAGDAAGRSAAVDALAAATGYLFRDTALAVCALTHVSWPAQPAASLGTRRVAGAGAGAGAGGSGGGHYQLLEFLGDAVIGLLASLWAYSLGGSPRDMSLTREALVRNDTLAACCIGSGLSAALRLRHRQLQLAIAEYRASLVLPYSNTSGGEDAAATGAGVLPGRADAWAEAVAARDRQVAALLQSAGQAVDDGTGAEEWRYTPWSTDGDGSNNGMSSSSSSSSSCYVAGGDNSSSGAAAGPRVPKVLADVVEAALGAIWLDSSGDLAACEQAFKRLLLQHPEIAATSAAGPPPDGSTTAGAAARLRPVVAGAVPSTPCAARPQMLPVPKWGWPVAASPQQLRQQGNALHYGGRPPHSKQRPAVLPAAAAHDEAPTSEGYASGRRGGRPARRLNPLGHSALLSAYNASALREMAGLMNGDLKLEVLPGKTHYAFTHKEWQASALTHPSVLSSFGVGCLSSSHMAILGEDLLRLAAIELSWTATSGAGPSGDGGGAPGGVSKSSESLLSAAASTVKKITELVGLAPGGSGSGVGTDVNDDEAWELPLQCTAALLNKAAAAVAAAGPQLAEKWQIEQHVCGFGAPAGKQEKLTCCKALLAAAYLDGGYGAVRAMLGPWVAEVLRAAPERDMQRTAWRIQQLLAQPQPAGMLHDDVRAPTNGSSVSGHDTDATGMSHGHLVLANAEDANEVDSALDVVARGQYAPMADLHWRSLLGGLRLLGGFAEGYAPRDVEHFRELCDLWYAYLCSSASTLLPSSAAASWLGAKGIGRATTIERRSAAAKALLALGGAVYGVLVSELVLERCLTRQALELRCPADNKLRRTAADEARRERAELMQDAVRLAQMEAGLGLCRPEAKGMGGAGVYGTTQQHSVGPLLTRCADGVVAAVALEGGLRRARHVVRGLVAVAEAADVEVRLSV
ncbi:hypothetical protein HXX76_015465 [Chlamydomonas incerta]|uniref:Dicer-like protein n=1 Tax=Chlamydomonas incerta TaxID=51695 RepID=A0A835VND1_CHLIN|nr:hypothetical protein HXX76_015465 [Chlamydomonas incerta]|eukprot:KAG2423207.1 hypothetical protein HXX76_015465 [Chlamydomonas incerta]